MPCPQSPRPFRPWTISSSAATAWRRTPLASRPFVTGFTPAGGCGSNSSDVSPATVASLLGEDFPCAVVERVTLTHWQLQKERQAPDPDDPGFDSPFVPTPEGVGTLEAFETPVEMVRVLVPGVRPVHSLDGWPVSFWHRSGRGLVLFTTLGPRAWVTPLPPAKTKASGNFQETRALKRSRDAVTESARRAALATERHGMIFLQARSDTGLPGVPASCSCSVRSVSLWSPWVGGYGSAATLRLWAGLDLLPPWRLPLGWWRFARARTYRQPPPSPRWSRSCRGPMMLS